MSQTCEACGRQVGDRDTACVCGESLTSAVTFDDWGAVGRQRPFGTGFGGYSRRQVDEFIRHLVRLLAAYNDGTVTDPEFTSTDVAEVRFRLTWRGYRPAQVDEWMTEVMATLNRQEAVAGCVVGDRPHSPVVPRFFGALPAAKRRTTGTIAEGAGCLIFGLGILGAMASLGTSQGAGGLILLGLVVGFIGIVLKSGSR